MQTRALLSSLGVLLSAVLLWWGGGFAALTWARGLWLVLLLAGFIEGLLPRAKEAPRLSSALAVLFLFRAAQPLLGQLLLDQAPQHLSAAAAGSLSYLLMALGLLPLAWRSRRPSAGGASWPARLALGALGGLLSAAILLFFVGSGASPTEAPQGPERYWLLGLFWVASPLWEELCFRGLLLPGLHALSGQRAWSSVCVSAAVFASMHEGALLPPIFALGIISALAYIRTRTLIAPMLTHLLHNLTAWHLGAF